MGRAYDYWSLREQENYNPDGTMKETYRQKLLDRGYDFFYTCQMEYDQKQKVKNFEEMEKEWKDRGYTKTYSEFLDSSRNQQSLSQQKRRQEQALSEGAEISELPFDIDPDDYYDYHSN